MTLKQLQVQGNEAIQSYDYFDYITGRGYRSIYLAQVKDSGGLSYFATTDSAVISDPNATSTVNARYLLNTDGQKSFDIVFNTPARISGDAFINYTLGVTAASSTGHAVFDFYQVHNAVETSIGSVTGASQSSPGGAAINLRLAAKVSLTDTSFTIGDILRVKVTAVLDVNGGGATTRVWIDPASVQSITETPTGGTVPSNLVIRTPFLIIQ